MLISEKKVVTTLQNFEVIIVKFPNMREREKQVSKQDKRPQIYVSALIIYICTTSYSNIIGFKQKHWWPHSFCGSRVWVSLPG